MHISNDEEEEKWIEDYLDGETAVARELVENAETAIKNELEDMRNAEKAGLTTTNPETESEEMLHSIRESVSDLGSSDDREDGEDVDDAQEDPQLGTLSKDNEHGWEMGKISRMVQHCSGCVRQKETKFDKVTQLG